MSPLGLGGTKLLSDILIDMKVSRAARARLPIICDFVGPIWVPGGPIAERAKVTDETERLIVLTIEPVRT